MGLVGDGWDGDGDGFSNLQEFLDGTDPKDPLSKSQKPAKLELPPMDIEVQGNGVVVKTSSSTGGRSGERPDIVFGVTS